jgi:hypothetical protein
MNQHEVQDVEFKEVQQSQMIDGNKEEIPSKPKHRILHVQVEGNPTVEELNTTAQAFQKALESGSVANVTTTGNVRCFNIFNEGEAPFNGLLVRGAVTLSDIARTIHDALMVAYSHGFKHWYDLSAEQQAVYVKYAKDELRGFKHKHADDEAEHATKERMISAIVTSLKHCLPSPQMTNLIQSQVWNGSPDIDSDSAWVDVSFAALKESQIWRNKEASPFAYYSNVGDSYINYEGQTSYVTVDCIEAVPSPEAINGEVVMKWKIKAMVEAEAKKVQEEAEADKQVAPQQSPDASEAQVHEEHPEQQEVQPDAQEDQSSQDA